MTVSFGGGKRGGVGMGVQDGESGVFGLSGGAFGISEGEARRGPLQL